MDTIDKLATAGAHFILCAPDKRPQGAGWQKNGAKPGRVREWLASHSGHLYGVIPASLGCTVVDVDEGDPEPVASAARELQVPALVVPTRRPGGAHVWLRATGSLGNRKFAGHGASGDIRAARGFVVLWHPNRVAAWLSETAPADPPYGWLERVAPRVRKGGGTGRLVPVGERNEELNRSVFLAVQRGEPVQPHIEAARAAGLGEEEIRATVDSATRAGERARSLMHDRRKQKAERLGERETARIAAADPPATSLPEASGENGNLGREKSASTLARAFERMGISVRYDLRGHSPQVKFRGPWMRTNDRIVAWLREEIALRFTYATTRGPSPLRFGSASWETAFQALLATRECDPFREWLEGLPAWDGIERIDHILLDQFEPSTDRELCAWASRYLFLGPVERAYAPGSKQDEMPVLIGPQGLGKSALLRGIVPPEQPGWFADGLHLAADAKSRAESLQGRVIVEAAEMAGASRADLEALKAFVSRQDDGSVRLAYRRDAEVMMRRCIIVGTSNDQECLPNDPTGLRRFVPIVLTQGCDVEAMCKDARLQWWAEALQLYRGGARARLPRALIEKQARAAEGARRTDEMLEVRIGQIEKEDRSTSSEPLFERGSTLAQLAVRLGMADAGLAVRLDARTARRLAQALRARGWQKERSMKDGQRSVLWAPG